MVEKWNEEVAEFARNVRIDVAKVLNRTNDSHIGGGYSSIDILAVLYKKVLALEIDLF